MILGVRVSFQSNFQWQKLFTHRFFLFCQNENFQVSSVVDSLENLQSQNIGVASFQLPDNLEELQQVLGGEGACVPIGFSVIALEDGL